MTTGVKAFNKRLKVFTKNRIGLLLYISLKKRGMVFMALKESLTLVFSSLSVMDFNVGLAISVFSNQYSVFSQKNSEFIIQNF